jgi:hypothetical protein
VLAIFTVIESFYAYSMTVKIMSQIKYVTVKILMMAHMLLTPNMLASIASDRLNASMMSQEAILSGIISPEMHDVS